MKTLLPFTHHDIIPNLALFLLWNAKGELNQSNFVLKHYVT